MANPSGRKGSSWERDCAQYLAEFFPGVERRVKNGRLDRGDITGIPDVVIECKAERQIDLPGYLGELDVECDNAKANLGFVFIKNRRHGVGDGYAVMSIESARTLLCLLRDKGML
jgi:hypothetical protein